VPRERPSKLSPRSELPQLEVNIRGDDGDDIRDAEDVKGGGGGGGNNCR
jgi:hypothetical protein